MVSRRNLFVIATAALALILPLGLSAAAEAKKKAKSVDITQPGGLIPDQSGGVAGVFTSTISVGSKFKGLKIRDVNVTVQTTGSSTDAANDMLARLSAPSGASTFLFLGLSGQNVGPLTLDDESAVIIFSAPPPPQSSLLLFPPYNGTAQPGFASVSQALAVMDGGPVRGSWVLTILDTNAGDTSVVNSWRLQVKTGRKYKTD